MTDHIFHYLEKVVFFWNFDDVFIASLSLSHTCSHMCVIPDYPFSSFAFFLLFGVLMISWSL